MILIPAIDIKDGKVVRLFQGKFSEVTEYGNDPQEMARKWVSLGAQWLHVVDLDGAREGAMGNKQTIMRLAKSIGIPIEVGGGIRDEQTVDELIDCGIARVILGTKAIENRDLLKRLLTKYADKICVSLDCANGFVAGRGWVTTTTVKATDLAQELEAMGLQWLVYTDIAKDGTLAGPNYAGIIQMLKTVRIPLIASGGIASLEDVQKLSQMKGVAAAITGKAIYEGKLDFAKALEVLRAK
jgi:phosphoribosylformimino-5-aminoimidazole carboxamide ribotide isomerase